MAFVAKDNARLRRLFLQAGAGAITGADIAPSAIGTSNLAPGSVTSAILAPGTVATAAQGALADTALQDPSAFATAAQGVLAATAHGWGNHALAGYQGALSFGIYELQTASGGWGGVLASGAWTMRALTTEVLALSGATLGGGQVTLPAGTYFVYGEAAAYWVGAHRVALFVGGAAFAHGTNVRTLFGDDVAVPSSVISVVTGPAVVDLRHWVEASNGDSTDGGMPVTTGDAERYAKLIIVKVA